MKRRPDASRSGTRRVARGSIVVEKDAPRAYAATLSSGSAWIGTFLGETAAEARGRAEAHAKAIGLYPTHRRRRRR